MASRHARDLALLDSASAEDRSLADALIAIARDVRAQEWAALGDLLAILQGEPGDLATRCAGLPTRDMMRAAVACFALGWIGTGPIPA